MSQTPAAYEDAKPCPQCGNQHLIQHITQSEDLHVDADGNVEHIEPRDYVEVQEVWCPDCDEKIWENE